MRLLMLGSTAEKLLSRTTCPVLVVKQAPHDNYRTLLVAIDFSPSSLRATRQAQAIASHAEIVLLHAVIVPFEGHLRYASSDDDTIHHYWVVARQDETQALRTLRDEAGLSPDATRLLVLHGDLFLRIVEQEQEQDCDLIVMGKHSKGIVEQLGLGSITKQVLAEFQGDVLVLV